MSDVQEHLAKMLRTVGVEKITVRNIEKVWVRIRMWEYAVRCSRWDADADDQWFTTPEEVRENVGVAAGDGAKKLTDVQFDRQLAHNVRGAAEKSYASLMRLNCKAAMNELYDEKAWQETYQQGEASTTQMPESRAAASRPAAVAELCTHDKAAQGEVIEQHLQAIYDGFLIKHVNDVAKFSTGYVRRENEVFVQGNTCVCICERNL
ncbi:hypothetical protein ACFU99_05925 [Streptomyces sp. NPDC057654]|uniref:hypothetical protein n=1 Tax=Streptomyces sp. NPDC057654 TaxID=3346196 RepID=UPI0036A20835